MAWDRKQGKSKKELGIITPNDPTKRASREKRELRVKLSKKNRK